MDGADGCRWAIACTVLQKSRVELGPSAGLTLYRQVHLRLHLWLGAVFGQKHPWGQCILFSCCVDEVKAFCPPSLGMPILVVMMFHVADWSMAVHF